MRGRIIRKKMQKVVPKTRVQINFMRPHGGLGGRTSVEVAGIPIADPDKWRTLIGHAALLCA